MRLGILVLSIGAFGRKGYYNLQEVGLAKELDKQCDEVKVYKLVSREQVYVTEKIESTDHATITYLPSKAIGTNGIPSVHLLDSSLDAYICCSDTQLMFPKISRWAKRNHIQLYPYIGVVDSHSSNPIKEFISNLLFRRNIMIYRKCNCFVKTPYVKQRLLKMGVDNIEIIPVGLDLSLTKKDYKQIDVEELKRKYGYNDTHRIVLFIGRFIDEKRPVEMINIMVELIKADNSYRLIMVGDGALRNEVENRVKETRLVEYVQFINAIPNSDIWELYRISDCFVNLNRQEIFGMSILEAMYYGCRVVAIDAPGPNLIIENGVSGDVVKSSEQVIEAIKMNCFDKDILHDVIVNQYSWRSSAEKMAIVLQKSNYK